jgi:tetratricopeptide (TPR) repeat protein
VRSAAPATFKTHQRPPVASHRSGRLRSRKPLLRSWHAERALRNARETGQATTLFNALHQASYNYTMCGNYTAANAQADELIALADKGGATYWKALGTAHRGSVFALTGKGSDAVQTINSALASLRSTAATLYEPYYLQYLAMAYAELGQPDDARRCISDAIDKVEMSKEKWCEALPGKLH